LVQPGSPVCGAPDWANALGQSLALFLMATLSIKDSAMPPDARHASKQSSTGSVAVQVLWLTLALALPSCQSTVGTSPSVTDAVQLVPVVDVAPLSESQIEVVLSEEPVNSVIWAQEIGLFGNKDGVVGYAEMFFGKGNALARHGIGQPMVVDGQTNTIEGSYVLASGYELPHAIRVIILVDNQQASIRSGAAQSPYVAIPRLAPGERVGLKIYVPVEPGWHTLHFVLLADSDVWLEDPSIRIHQRFSFTATRYEVFVEDIDPSTMLDASDLGDPGTSTASELRGIQLMDSNSDAFINDWDGMREGNQTLRVQVFGDPFDGEPAALAIRWIVFVNDMEVSSSTSELQRTSGESQFVTLQANLGPLEPGDQIMLMAIPYPDTPLTLATGRTLRYGLPTFSQRVLVK